MFGKANRQKASMFDAIDRAYYAKRADQERDLAERATHAYVAKIHLALAQQYDRKASALKSDQSATA